MKKMMIILAILIMLGFVLGKRIEVLSGINKPDAIDIFNGQVYLVEGSSIFKYSLKDLKLLKSFGREGTGPGELKDYVFWSNSINVSNKNIFVEGLNKFIYFSFNGKLIGEQRKHERALKILPVGKNFVLKTFPQRNKEGVFGTWIKVVDSQMKDLKRLCFEPIILGSNANRLVLIPDATNFCVNDDKIFIENSHKGFQIEIYDCNGQKASVIKHKEGKIKVDRRYRDIWMNYLKESFLSKRASIFVPINIARQSWEKFKKWADIKIPEYLPQIRDIVVNQNKIYLQTFQNYDGKELYYILNMKGEIEKKVFLPEIKGSNIYDSLMLGTGSKFYDIDNNKFVYLEEDLDNEEWLLKVIKL